ncbi:cytochrome b5-related protein [Orussus abietinus]|uniref:cytochrome b5-related protein n=1 Tax=Orussus abietinus TaxID=222816 RepID=UPI000625FFD9|nr:cytochrome b5-related protein [Orussus abietinus]
MVYSKFEKSLIRVPGLAYLPARDDGFATGAGFMKSRRETDGAEDLWRVQDKLYDLNGFASFHPGGAEWIRLTKGTDITEAFEVHHLTDKAERMLPKFYIRDAKTPRSVPLTFETNGFYKSFKRRAVEALKDVNIHRPSTRSNVVTDSIVASTVTFCVMAAFFQSWILAAIAGLFLAWTASAGHNYMHMRDNFRMYYMDLCLLSSKLWRITHVLSHHMYPNTHWDYEIYAYEPFIQWLPAKDKSLIAKFLPKLGSPLIWSMTFFQQGVQRIVCAIFAYGVVEFRDVVPLILPLSMYLVTSSLLITLKTWFLVILFGGFFFGFIGVNAAHHHPDIFHEGDIFRSDFDWGLFEMDAVRDRNVIDDSLVLTLMSFGSHGLHHLLPTVDHDYLPLCYPAFQETCKEFGIDCTKWNYWTLVGGQFEQLGRVEPKKNWR